MTTRLQDISLHAVSNTAECEALMARGWNNRATGATKMNADSSRSHSIFTINIEMMDTGAGGSDHIRKVGRAKYNSLVRWSVTYMLKVGLVSYNG